MTRSHYSERHNLWTRARDPHPINSWSKNVSVNPKIPTHDWSHCLFHSPLWKMKTIVEMMVKSDLYITNHTISRHERKTQIVIYFIYWVWVWTSAIKKLWQTPHTSATSIECSCILYLFPKLFLDEWPTEILCIINTYFIIFLRNASLSLCFFSVNFYLIKGQNISNLSYSQPAPLLLYISFPCSIPLPSLEF